MRACTSSGSVASDAAVKPTRSQNSTETTLRSSRAGDPAVSANCAPQKGQNGNSPGSSFPQAGQLSTRRVYSAGAARNQPARGYVAYGLDRARETGRGSPTRSDGAHGIRPLA